MRVCRTIGGCLLPQIIGKVASITCALAAILPATQRSPANSMSGVKTPCIGICSTTSFGDAVCRGCKRYAFEVIGWNSYDAVAKQAVLHRIEKLICQILENKLRIFSVPNLQAGLEQFAVQYDPTLSPYCWLHNLLKKCHRDITNLAEYGAYVLPEYQQLPLAQLCELLDTEILLLTQAHHERYYAAGLERDAG